MTNSRTIQISLDHLVAEMVSFPFVSRCSLEIPNDALALDLSDATGALWRAAEREFVQSFPHLGLDELVSLRNSIWFGMHDPDQAIGSIPMHEYLRYVSHQFLVQRGATAIARLPGNTNHDEAHDPAARRAWRWLTFAMPADLLLAGLARNNSGPVRVNLLSPSVEIILREHGYAETHLHLGAALDFPTVWASAMNMVARSAPNQLVFSEDAFRSPGADFDEGKSLGSWLVRGAIVRDLLGSFLVNRRSGKSLDRYLREIGPLLDSLSITATHQSAIRIALRDVHRGELSDDVNFAALQNAYNALTRASLQPLPKRFDEVQKLDPLSRFFAANGHPGPSVQLQFLWKGLEYLENEPGDRLFPRLFWQVERVRGQVYRHCIQRPLTPGLMNFIRYYERKGAITGALQNIELESAGRLGGTGHGLKSLEVRMSPVNNAEAQLQIIHALRDQYQTLACEQLPQNVFQRQQHEGRFEAKAWQACELGLVLHLLKSRGKATDTGLPRAFDLENNADPCGTSNGPWYRWHAYSQKLRQTANAVAGAIEKDPNILYLLRGLDVCRDEHGVPTWVYAPWFEPIRAAAYVASENHRSGKRCELPMLRSTAHLGEDFVHLVSGLRYMDQAIDYIPLSCGDRVGHGLALGVEPRTWATKASRLAMPREDRFFDLVWEREWHAKQGSRFGSDRKTFVDDEIIRLAQAIFGDDVDWTPKDAMEFVKLLHTPSVLKRMGFPNQMIEVAEPQGICRFVERYLTQPGLYRRCRTIEWVNASIEADAVVELQRLVRKRYADLGITIEVNPISNLLVGDLTDIKSHPLWRLASGLDNEKDSTLRICIGSDDPFPFATNLPEEYQFLFDALVLAGHSQAEARIWLDSVRRIGLESRFTLPVVGFN
jgi:hypothetical protein